MRLLRGLLIAAASFRQARQYSHLATGGGKTYTHGWGNSQVADYVQVASCLADETLTIRGRGAQLPNQGSYDLSKVKFIGAQRDRGHPVNGISFLH